MQFIYFLFIYLNSTSFYVHVVVVDAIPLYLVLFCFVLFIR